MSESLCASSVSRHLTSGKQHLSDAPPSSFVSELRAAAGRLSTGTVTTCKSVCVPPRPHVTTGEKSTCSAWRLKPRRDFLPEHFVYVPPLGESKSNSLPACSHNNGGSCQCANLTRIQQPDKVFLCRRDDSGSWLSTAPT